jgi:peptidoglycan/xylan/chitin deacetylase (PgdA/CDA1 family)
MNSVMFVMYHYVRDLEDSRYPLIKGLSTVDFIKQIEYLHKMYRIISMEEVIYSIDNNRTLPNNSVVLTFDDGYIDHYLNVFPVLDRLGIQGSFFIPVRPVMERIVLNDNKIQFILSSSDDSMSVINDIKNLLKKNSYIIDDFDNYYKKIAIPSSYDSGDIIFIKRTLQTELPEGIRNKIVDKLFNKYVGVEESVFSKELYVNEEQVNHMRRNNMHIGIHGYNHSWWSKIDRVQLEKEIGLSLDFISEIGMDMDNWTACYPHGSYDKQVVDVLEEKGCKLALTIEDGVARVSKKSRFLFPRIDTINIPINTNIKIL